MSHRSARRRSLFLAVAGLMVASLVACGSNDDSSSGGSGSGSGSTASDQETTGKDGSTESSTGDDKGSDVADPYHGHTSKTYDGTTNWICHPDLDDDVCHHIDVTKVSADGSTQVEEREAAADPPIDCFYVYPTVSSDQGANSDLEVKPDDNEVLTVIAQAAQFSQACRVFAPVYRQVPLVGLGGGQRNPDAFGIAYGDVVDAWKTYISQWNEGRGVILIGHSQGTGHLTKLVKDEIDDNDELRSRMVAAYLFGTTGVQVPEGKTVGGTFDHIPACTSSSTVGCVVTWSSYPHEQPPVDNAIFGKAAGDGQRALCVNALDLLDRDRGNPVAPMKAPLIGGAAPIDATIKTPFVSLPDAVTLSCETHGDYDYLGVGIADPANDKRPLDRLVQETLGPTWGLHLLDVTVAMDDLVQLAKHQAQAFG